MFDGIANDQHLRPDETRAFLNVGLLRERRTTLS